MDAPFVYDNPVTGKNFVGRKTECTVLANLLEAGEHVCLYDIPKSGKTSLVQQTLYNMRAAGKPFMVAYVNAFNVRTSRDFLKKFGGAVLRSAYSTPDDYAAAIGRHLEGTHFVFDAAMFASKEDIVCMNWDPDFNDVYRMMQLPQQIAREKEMPFYVIIKAFQKDYSNIDYELLLGDYTEIEEWIAVKEYNEEKRPQLHLYVELSPKALISQAISKEILREHLSVYFKYVDQDYQDLKRILGVDPLEITILRCGTFALYQKQAGKPLRKINPSTYDVMDLVRMQDSVEWTYRGGMTV